MEQKDLNARTGVLEERSKNVFHQLDEIKESLKELQNLTRLCENIHLKLQNTEEKLSDTVRRLEIMERAPGEDLRHYRRSAVVCLITAFLSALLSAAKYLSGNL